MNKILLLAAICLPAFSANAQVIKKMPIKTSKAVSGCSLYSFCEFDFDASYSEDSSLVYSGECTAADITYGIICVKLQAAVPNLDDAEALTINYLDFLKNSFSITKSAGYGKGHTLRNNDNTRGVLDYWEDKDHNNWKVKAWTNKSIVAVLFVHSPKELPETKMDVYLNGFLFPGM